MRLWFAFLLTLFAAGAGAQKYGEESSTRDKYVSPAQDEAPEQHYIFDRRGNPTVYQKKDKKDKRAEKKKKSEKEKKLTKKPGKRRPKGWNAGRKRGSKKPAAAPSSADDANAPEPPDAAPEGDGQGLDYGGVNLGDDAKVAVPGSGGAEDSPPPYEDGESGDPAFRPSPPQSQ